MPQKVKMDESLDDYISKSNFKVKIGNPQASGFQGKKRFTQGFQGNKVTDVSVTVPGPGVQKTAGNQNRTNQVRDARDRLLAKNKPKDAREKLMQKSQNADARQKLITIRAQKDTGPVDARAKIQAKKQQLQQPGAPVQVQTGNFTLTRTVSNSNNNNIQLTPGVQGNIHITKTLTKVMPPGYEGIIKPNVTATPTTIKRRLGPPGGPSTIPNITRTVPNTPIRNPNPSRSFQPIHSPDPPYPVPESPTQPFNQAPPQQFVRHEAPPRQYNQPGQAPPPQYAPVGQTTPYPPQSYGAPPSTRPTVPPGYVLPGTVRPNPPYPIEDHQGVQLEVSNPHQGPIIPRIQVQNDQYRPPSQVYPQYLAPPTQQQYAPPTQYIYAPPPQPAAQPVYYQAPPQQDTYIQRGVPVVQHTSDSFVKTIVNDVPTSHTQSVAQSSSRKRNSFGEPLKLSSGSGPLKSSNKNYVPIISTGGDSEVSRKKFTRITGPDEPSVKRVKEETVEDTEVNVISPLQGYKIVITNLATTVTQDDIIELFGAIGAVKSVKMVKPGLSEVIYVKKDDAVSATKTYHERELDGKPMIVKMMTPMSARIKEAPQKLPPSEKPVEAEPLKFSKKVPVGTSKVPEKKGVDVGVLHKALFKTGGTSGPTKPVTFTVNI